MYSDFDAMMMRQALALAEHALYTATPNPRVGCVITQDENIIGEGYTQPAGQNHAEPQALQAARLRGAKLQGATAYVTLEPCSHIGRTPPCVHALIKSGISRVVVAMEDPNPLVSGRGLQALRDAGISVHCGLLKEAAQELNIGFIHRMHHSRPWVRMKIAASVDGKIALYNGQSQWITSAQSRQDNHAWRARACAILSGIGTVRHDNPQLNVRGITTPRQPLKVIVDSNLQIPETSRLLHRGLTLIATADLPEEQIHKRSALQAHGVDIVTLPNAHGKVDLPALMHTLAERGINEVHTEAGNRLNGALLKAHCVDELLIYLAPSILGDGCDMFHIGPLASLNEKHDFRFHHVEKVGQEVRLILRRPTLSTPAPPFNG
ncbi:MAG: bifunctional diaminohydroxyphosphoribosylaminopyrimidine deaminase/5-amino-6-(5-phosphoribosylamino)uracil reductase RibD [Ottowia sp.]|nr:bifunctional diaminohydroxyphosphoribosylaminopyrimidine deaminase/5-amino-6-(5-phosphoribosylamino)uracil reductase RibD [Ottowia sp.]